VRLGTLVTPLARRRPAKLARETVSLDHLSGGRLVLGVGLGHPPDADFAAFGEDADARVRARKLDEGLDVLAGFWSGRPFSYEGEHYRIAETTFLPPPVQSPRIPVWDGVALDGWWDGHPLTPDDLRAILAFIKEHRTSTTSFDVAYGAPLPGDDPARAAETIAAYAEAGLTWWIGGCDPWRESLTDLHAKIRRGPPG
ncbi:MAG: LLM class flavin-dependent oxidoreductase, partial [Chloroflexota bacterium]|nr:LLM class flavin-dependent oxidoreductase [Chloroflexota bacterium]